MIQQNENALFKAYNDVEQYKYDKLRAVAMNKEYAQSRSSTRDGTKVKPEDGKKKQALSESVMLRPY